MQRDFESQAEACSNKKRHRRIWKRIVGTLACVVVFCTTYALILPAITMEGMKCGMEEHTHSMDCYVKNEPEVLTELSCSPESLGCHVHSDSCKDADGNIICGYADYIIHTHNDSCYDSKGNKICELEEIEEHVHTDECYEIETVTSQESAVEETAGESGETVSADSTETANTEASEDNTTVKKTLVCTKEAIEEHKHTEECYDEDNNLICGKLETIKHVHEDSCFQKTEEAIRAETLTCGLKESDEHQHTALCYGDWELVCGLEEHTHTEECYPEEETETTDDESADTNAEVSEEVQNVITLIDEMPSADEIDAKMKEFEDAEDYEGEEAWLTEVYQQVAKAYYYYDLLSDEEKELVSNADKLLELEYIWSVTEYVSAIDSEVVDQDDVVAASSTKDFIELNLYDYFGTANASANGKTNINSLWNSNSAYPGFQWNGGAYRTDNYGTYKSGDEDNGQFLTDRNKVDDIDFGNSMITDFDYAGSNYEKSTSAQIPTTKTDTNALINFTYENTNRPIGISTYGQETFSSVVSGNLNSDGYPSLVNTSLTDSSLKYLFTESIYAKKMNSDNIDGLFKKNSVTGEYSFNSRENHAQFDSSTNLFTLYNKIITPNFILYPFGNFLPFNDITDANKVTQVSAINYMFGDKGYVDELIERMETSAGYSSDTSKKQLVAMLKAYRANVKEWPGVPGGDTYIGNIDWDGWSAEDALNDFFNYYNYHNSSAEEPNDEIINFKTNSELQAHLQKMYNIDYDIDKNFFFGMEMKMNFMQPKGGVTGEDTNKDGTPDYDMVFEFTGDDDVWVYIDDILFLDLTGIHRHVGGKIDFVNGMVYYYALDSDGNGDISDNAYYEISFAKILTEVGGIKTSELGQYLKYDETTKTYSTFLDYSTHSFNFYYMERGSGSSVCSINFNFPLLRQNSISVSKEVSSEDNITELGNPDFKFQVLAATDAGEKTENLFIPAGTPYALYDAEGKAIQQVRVTKNPDGTLVTKEGLTLYTVTKADGTTVEGTVNDFINDTTIYKTDTNGIFPLKAGQKAEFVGISELAGKYYVRELLEDTIDEQYGTITVTGQAVTKTESLTIGSVAFIGLESPIYDASNASTSFEFNNKITTSELGKLKIQKILNLYDSSSDETREFEFAVTLDGEPLPVGTAYSILDSNGTDTRKKGTVEIITENGVTKSLVKISSGQIALIENILAGSAFTVEETSNSSKGYTVQYEAFDDSKIVISDGIVSGTIPVEAAIGVKIINAENGANVSIAGIKRLVAYDGVIREYSFMLKEVTLTELDDGTTVNNIEEVSNFTPIIQTVKVEDSQQYFKFTLNYIENDLQGRDTFYYQITEINSSTDDTRDNTKVYIAKVEVTESSSGGIDAKVTKMWSAGSINGTYAVEEEHFAEYVNYVVNALKISKTVKGSTASLDNEYEFVITLKKGIQGDENVGNAFGAYLEASYPVKRISTDAARAGTWNLSFDGDGEERTAKVYLKDGESIIISNLPVGTKWSITENTPDGFKVTSSGTVGVTASGATASGTITKTESEVSFTNTQFYELPESGGFGTFKYTMAGLLLLCSAAYLLYKQRKCMRRVG